MKKEFDDLHFEGPFGMFLDFQGQPIERNPWTHPYNFEDHVVWDLEGTNVYQDPPKGLESVYSDRLFKWDHEKYNSACQSVWGNSGQYFDSPRTPQEIESFLSIYFNKRIKLYRIMKSCNQSSGYPLWVFFYTEE